MTCIVSSGAFYSLTHPTKLKATTETTTEDILIWLCF